jgi:hypothetical protein
MSYLVFAVIVLIAAVMLQPKPPGQKPPSLSEIDVPTAAQGKPVPKVFGKRIVQSPNIVWYGDLGYNKVTQSGSK